MGGKIKNWKIERIFETCKNLTKNIYIAGSLHKLKPKELKKSAFHTNQHAGPTKARRQEAGGYMLVNSKLA